MRRSLTQLRHRIGVSSLLAATLVIGGPATASATHVALAWQTAGVASWHWEAGADERTVTTTFDSFAIAVGAPVTVDVTDLTFHYFDPGPDGCDDGNPADSTVPLSLFFLMKVDAGETIFDYPATVELIELVGSGTHHTSTHTCIDPSVARNEFASDIHFTFDTASLAPGCYQPSPYSPETSSSPDPVGSIAVLSVGGVDCTFNDPGELAVAGAYSYSGLVEPGVAALIGTDSIVVTGTPAGLAKVTQVCVSSTWTATVQIRTATSIRFEWNGTLAIDPVLEATSVSLPRPNKDGLFKGSYSESMTWQRCVADTSHAFPALATGPLTIVHPNPFTKVTHSSKVWAVLDDGRTLQVSLPTSKAGPGVVNWAKAKVQLFDLF